MPFYSKKETSLQMCFTQGLFYRNSTLKPTPAIICTFLYAFQEIEKAVVAFAKRCHDENCQSAIITIMSHGRLNTISGTDLETVSKSWIQQQFDGNHCKNLDGKPKVFFYQACCEGKNLKITHSPK